MRPTSVSDLPLEILEHILSSLPPADILKMKEVSRFFLGLVSSSQHLQHRIDLFSAGLIDNPHTACSLVERRALLRKYVDGWKDTEPSVRYDLPLSIDMGAFRSSPIDWDLFTWHSADRRHIPFLRVPSSPNQRMKEWTLEFQFRFNTYVTRSQDNLLAVIEQGTECINVHLLSLLDGTPHEVPQQKVLELDLECDGFHNWIIDKKISESRIAIMVESLSLVTERYSEVLIVWDWRTGKVVLEHSSHDPGIGNEISHITNIYFLEGSWLLALSRPRPAPRLLVFDTQLPQEDPRSWQILDLPPVPPLGRHLIFTRRENPFAACSEFLVDPAQRIFALFSTQNLLFIVPVELLVRYTHSVRTSSCIPWDEWGKDVVTVHLDPNTLILDLFDTKVLVLHRLVDQREMWGVDVYDLSRSGQRDIQVQQIGEGVDERRRRVLPAPKWFIPCPKGDNIYHTMSLLGNVVYFIGRSRSTGPEDLLRVWILGQTSTVVNGPS